MYLRATLFITCCMLYSMCSAEYTVDPSNVSMRALRSYGGVDVFSHEMPFVVLLMGSKNYSHYFTGIAIKPHVVITSANGARSSFVEYVHYGRNHYWYYDQDISTWTVKWKTEWLKQGGTVGIEKKRIDPNYITSRITYELWDYRYITLHYNDIGAVYTQHAMEFRTDMSFPHLIVNSAELDRIFEKESLTFYGFGRTHNDTELNVKPHFADHNLRKTVVKAVKCFDEKLTKCCYYCKCFQGTPNYSIPCLGDSGGPFVYQKHGRHYVVAINSAMYYCQKDSKPGQYFAVRTDSVLTNYIIDDLSFDLEQYEEEPKEPKPQSLTNSLWKEKSNPKANPQPLTKAISDETVDSSASSIATHYLLRLFRIFYIM